MEIVEIDSTVPTAITSTGIIFWMTLATVTMVGGRAGGAACGFAQPETNAANATERIAVRIKQVQHMYALEFLRDRVMIQVTTYRIGTLSPTLLIAHTLKCSTPESGLRLQANLNGWIQSLEIPACKPRFTQEYIRAHSD
jgi:hypothetical protein